MVGWKIATLLLQLRVLGLGLLQDGDVGVGVFPEACPAAKDACPRIVVMADQPHLPCGDGLSPVVAQLAQASVVSKRNTPAQSRNEVP